MHWYGADILGKLNLIMTYEQPLNGQVDLTKLVRLDINSIHTKHVCKKWEYRCSSTLLY